MSDNRFSNKDEALPEQRAMPHEVLGKLEAVALIVGIVIGAGIFKAPSMVAQMTGDVAWMFGAWFLGGVISLIGALCYAELATTYASAGGDYYFLRRAYGSSVSFLFAWARFSVIATGSIALLAFVFGDYLNQLLPLSGLGNAWASAIYGAAAIVVLSVINIKGIRSGAATQTWLTAIEVGGLLLIVVAALFISGNGTESTGSQAASSSSGIRPDMAFGLAMVFVLMTYGGWNEAAYISAELKNARHNMAKVMVMSILIITTLYLLVTWAYWTGLGMQGMAESEALAADLLSKAFGAPGQKAISAMVAVSALTSINATMIVGARTSYAAGCDWPLLAKLGQWNGERGTPAYAMAIQCIVALLLVGIGGLAGSGFKAMVEFTAPVFWLFFLLSGLSLFVLRKREPEVERPYKVPLYPLLPVLFCLSCAYMLWSSLSYVYNQSLGGLNAAWIGVAVLLIGCVLLLFVRNSSSSSAPTSSITNEAIRRNQ